MDDETIKALSALGANTGITTPAPTPPARRVLLGFLPAVLLSLLMMLLLVAHTVLAVAGSALDALARVCAFLAYWCIGATPPPGKWPRGAK